MKNKLVALLETIQVMVPQEAERFQVFGLHSANGKGLRYASLDESLAAKTVQITEISQAGAVPFLKVINTGRERVFLMAGEQLIGARQNRVLNVSILVEAATELVVPVSCVEAGRWHYRSTEFTTEETMSHGLLRKMMSDHVEQNYRRRAAPMSNQGEVWNEVARKLHCLGAHSPSAALHEAYGQRREQLKQFLAMLELPQGCSGVAFAIGGMTAGADLFDQPATLRKLWPKLARAYTFDALELSLAGKSHPAQPVTAGAVEEWLRSAASAPAQAYQSPGLGYDIRIKGAGVVGSALVVEDEPVHVELFGV